MEWKPYNVDKDVYRSMLVNRVVPAIEARWPAAYRHETIWLQQDNAGAHIKANDEGFQARVEQSELDIRLYSQPPNSPDLNVLDLGFSTACN